jgi:hypothetical protein
MISTIEENSEKIPDTMIITTINKLNDYKPYHTVEWYLEQGYSKKESNDYKHIIVNGNVNEIDKLWKKTKLYIEPFSNTKKYINSKKDIIEGKVDIPPIITINDLDENDLELSFENGRHRFANLRDAGVKNIPIIIANGEMYLFKKLNLINLHGGRRKKSKKRKNKNNKTKRKIL